MTEEQVIIGMDPHKSSNTIVVMTPDETMLSRGSPDTPRANGRPKQFKPAVGADPFAALSNSTSVVAHPLNV